MMVDLIVSVGVASSASDSAGGRSPRRSCGRAWLNYDVFDDRELEL
jgi:hypothetical protein